MILKDLIRNTLMFFHLDLTQNLKYDRLTKLIIEGQIRDNFNCIDIGAHKGEILRLLLKQSPSGKHYAFEPIPYLYNDLVKSNYRNVTVLPYALADSNGETTFQLVKNAPAYSGIKKRKYAVENPQIEEIMVGLRSLDSLIPQEEKIDFIKIDVEGAELGVLKGGVNTLKKNKPLILFECGKGASDYYGTSPLDIYKLITEEIGLKIYTLQSYVKKTSSLTLSGFEQCYETNSEYYFVAAN